MRSRRPIIVVRLSRDDLSVPGSLQEKAQIHEGIARELAERRGLSVAEEDVFRFLAIQGRRLVEEPEFRRLLAECTSGLVSHLITAYSDRLLRGDKHTEADIENALLDGAVTLLASDAVVAYDDAYESNHALTMEVKAAAARQYLRDIIKKLRESNRQRQLRGQKCAGMAPFGYTWIKPQYELRRLVDEGHYAILGDLAIHDQAAAFDHAQKYAPQTITEGRLLEEKYLALARRQSLPGGALLPGVVCTGGEYAILCEIFQRFYREGYGVIVRDFNRRGVPTTSMSRFHRGFATPLWNEITLRAIIRNPHYSGFPAHRSTTDRKGRKINLPPERWVLPEEEQEFPHPIRLPEQEALLQRIRDRASVGQPRLTSESLLTGMLKCSEGKPMRKAGANYTCRCVENAAKHPSSAPLRRRIDNVAYYVLSQALQALPPQRSPQSRKKDTSSVDMALKETQNLLRKRRELDDLQRHKSLFIRTGGVEGFAAAETELLEEIARMEREQRERMKEADQADATTALTRLEGIRKVGLEAFWQEANNAERRAVLRLVIQEIRIVAPSAFRELLRKVRVTVQPWIAPYYDPGEIKLKEAPVIPEPPIS